MAFWDKISARGSVEDRRGMVSGVSGIGLTGIALFVGINLLLGNSLPETLDRAIQLLPEMSSSNVSRNHVDYEGEDSYERFASTVLGSNDEVWRSAFEKIGKQYVPPRLVLFRDQTPSSCGGATSSIGPHYCPLDSTLYLDETFFDVLTQKLGAKGGDVAQAYVIAHEGGHHVQNILGKLKTAARTNEESVRMELQADCLAGVWAHSLKDKSVFEPNEISEAMDAAAAVGDDRIQEKAQGYTNPETWTHGSSEERVSAFTRGYEGGSLETCLSRTE